MQWPPDYSKEYDRRLKIQTYFQNNPEEWENSKSMYADHPHLWIRDFGMTYDPRISTKPDPETGEKRSKTMPFILFPMQVDFIKCLHECVTEGEGLLVEKSRDMGASWLGCHYSIHQWYFTDGFSAGWGSRKQDLVDQIGVMDSIFEKMRFILRQLPAFHLPKDFNIDTHATFLKIRNPENGSEITGEAGDNIGRGGRKSVYFKDESAHYDRQEKIEAALGDNTDVQVDISSVNGTNNVFYRRRKAGVVWEPDKKIESGVTRVFIMDWRGHPAKTEEWYKRRRDKAEREGLLVNFYQEVDRDYASSVEGIIIKPEWVKAAIDAHKKLGIEVSGSRIAALDVADEGLDSNAIACRQGIVLTHVQAWREGDTTETTQKAALGALQRGITEIYYDCIGVGAGVKGESNRLQREKKLPASLRFKPWNAGAAPLDKDKNIMPGDKDTPKNGDYFQNISAQAMWRLSRRFWKTYQAVTKGIEYPHDELISISSNISSLEDLVNELSQPTQGLSGSGKMIINKKPDGTPSPNLCDAVKMCYNPIMSGLDLNKLVTL